MVCDLRSLLWTSDKPIRLLVPLPSSRAGNLFITLHTPPKNVITRQHDVMHFVFVLFFLYVAVLLRVVRDR